MTAIKVAGVILTLNEGMFIEYCLLHLKKYLDYLLVFDGCSTDKTIDVSRRIANRVICRPFSGSYAEECNYAHDSLPPEYQWVLMCDADERFNMEFLSCMKSLILEKNVDCFRFPRINLDTTYNKRLLNPKDHQVRLYNRQKCYWIKPMHSVLWHKQANMLADQYSVYELWQYPIIHLKKPPEIRKAIQARWDTIEKQDSITKEHTYFQKL